MTFRSLLMTAPPSLRQRVMGLRFVPQNTDHHPEGNVLKHTILAVNNTLPYNDIDLAVTALMHDVGKDVTFAIGAQTGKPTAYGHDAVSAKLVRKYSDWVQSTGADVDTVHYLVFHHMTVRYMDKMRPFKQKELSDHPLFDKLVTFSDIDSRSRYAR